MAEDPGLGSRGGVNVKVERIGSSVSGEKFARVKVTAFGRTHVSAFPVGPLGGDDPKDFFDWLSSLAIPAQRQEKKALKQSISDQLNKALIHFEDSLDDHAIAIDRRGWNLSAFATKYASHGPTGRALIATARCSFIDTRAFADVSIDDVRAFYEKFGFKNALVKFVSCLSFLGPLLSVISDAPQPIFLLVAKPHRGKSSLLQVAGSVWGGDADGPLGYVSSLSGTANAIEQNAAEHRDMLFTLDDVQNLSPEPGNRGQAIFDILLRISSGRLRARLGEKVVDYRTVVLAASNDSTADLMKDSRIRSPDALLDRVFDLPCNYEDGALAWVPEDTTAEGFIRAMKARANKIRGFAGEHFVKELVKAVSSDPRHLRKKLRHWRNAAKATLRDPRLSPRAIDAFACVFAAGCLAAEFQLIPWKHDLLLDEVKQVFDNHVRYTKGELEKIDPIKLINRYVDKNGDYFLKVREREAKRVRDKDLAKCPGVEMTLRDGTKEYWLRTKDLEKALNKNMDVRVAAEKLATKGLIKLDKEGKPPKHVLGSKRHRIYRIDAKKLKKAH